MRGRGAGACRGVGARLELGAHCVRVRVAEAVVGDVKFAELQRGAEVVILRLRGRPSLSFGGGLRKAALGARPRGKQAPKRGNVRIAHEGDVAACEPIVY